MANSRELLKLGGVFLEADYPMKQIVNGQGVRVNDEYKDLMTSELARHMYEKMLFCPHF